MARQPLSPAEMFGFSPSSMGSLDTAELKAELDASDTIMIMADGAMFSSFDGLPVTMESMDDPALSQAFSMTTATTPAPGYTGDAGFVSFLPDDAAGPGAGPPPASNLGGGAAGAASAMMAGSTLTEFTKRRNWPAKVVEELRDLLQILDANGRIRYVSPSITPLTGYAPEEVLDRFLRDFIHADDVGIFVAELNESIATGNPLRLIYRMRRKGGGPDACFEVVGHAHIAAAKFAPNPNNQSPFCQAVFMMARPYPTKNAGLLDSFLEHKIENERLKRRIAELRREEQDELDDAQRSWQQSQEGRSDVTPSEGGTLAAGSTGAGAAAGGAFYIGGGGGGGGVADGSMPAPPPPQHSPSTERGSQNTALTRENLEGIAGSRLDSLRDKMARYEGATHVDTIEMLTGLRYQEGERSHGITTGNASPALIKGDAGIAIPMDRDPRSGEKKKKLKVAEEYVCTDCGTLDSPEWRKGPSGPKTLCNACGLRWAKKEKKTRNLGGATGNLSAMDTSGG